MLESLEDRCLLSVAPLNVARKRCRRASTGGAADDHDYLAKTGIPHRFTFQYYRLCGGFKRRWDHQNWISVEMTRFTKCAFQRLLRPTRKGIFRFRTERCSAGCLSAYAKCGWSSTEDAGVQRVPGIHPLQGKQPND